MSGNGKVMRRCDWSGWYSNGEVLRGAAWWRGGNVSLGIATVLQSADMPGSGQRPLGLGSAAFFVCGLFVWLTIDNREHLTTDK